MDKGNTVVVLHRTDYDTEVLDVLDSSQATHDPAYNFNSHIDKVRQAILKEIPVKNALLVPHPIPTFI